MTFWDYLNAAGERRAHLIELREGRPINPRLLANVIGCSLIFGFLGAIVALCFRPFPEANKDLLTYMLGQLSGLAAGVVSYHYTRAAGEKELEAQRAADASKALDAVAALASAPSPPPTPEN